MVPTTSPVIGLSSPLDTLVRKTSSRSRSKPRPYGDLSPPLTVPFTSPRGEVGGPDSPLLHTRFRASAATLASSRHDEYDASGDARSMFSLGSSHDSFTTPRDAPPMPTMGGGLREPLDADPRARGQSLLSFTSVDIDEITKHYRDSYGSTDTAQQQPAGVPSPDPAAPPVPTLVVTPWPEPEPGPEFITPESPPRAGRTPSRMQAAGYGVNFSRPGLPSLASAELEDRKRQVLLRHQHPSMSPLSSRSPSALSVGPAQSPSRSRPSTGGGPAPPSPVSDFSRSAPPSQALFVRLQGAAPIPSPSGSAPPRPPRPASPVSLYSTYSYYPPDAAGSSPTSPSPSGSPLEGFPALSPAATLSPTYVPGAKPSSKPAAVPGPAASASGGPTTPQEYLQLGIQHHEANRLAESAVCFELSATLQGGCGVGMLMWGLTQRHGWGCERSERAGFRWLRRAAEVAVEDLERARQGANTGVVKSELVLAIYEVGQSFYRGWGVEKDKKMAVSYFRVAAGMGDPDAQQELAFCLANGKGCKKDKREAAKWYRAAVAQGVSDIGLAWIYKEKYQKQ